MLISHRNVQGQHGDAVTEFLKLIVHENCLHCKAHTSIHSNNALKKEAKFGHILLRGMFQL